jgi:hypothetical protein
MLDDNIFTYTLTGSVLTLIPDYGVKSIAFNLLGGVVTVVGTMRLGAINSTPLTLIDSKPMTISDDNIISSLVIDATAGSVEIIARK